MIEIKINPVKIVDSTDVGAIEGGDTSIVSIQGELC